MAEKTKHKVYRILNQAEDGDTVSKIVDIFIMLLMSMLNLNLKFQG